MARQYDRKGSIDPARAAAEAMFKPAAPQRVSEAPALPNARELVSLRLDREVLDHFREAGAGWQDRINEALRKVVKS